MSDFIRIYTLRYVCSETGETLHEEPVFQDVHLLPAINAWVLVKGFPCIVNLIEAKDEDLTVATVSCLRVKKPSSNRH